MAVTSINNLNGWPRALGGSISKNVNRETLFTVFPEMTGKFGNDTDGSCGLSGSARKIKPRSEVSNRESAGSETSKVATAYDLQLPLTVDVARANSTRVTTGAGTFRNMIGKSCFLESSSAFGSNFVIVRAIEQASADNAMNIEMQIISCKRCLVMKANASR